MMRRREGMTGGYLAGRREKKQPRSRVLTSLWGVKLASVFLAQPLARIVKLKLLANVYNVKTSVSVSGMGESLGITALKTGWQN